MYQHRMSHEHKETSMVWVSDWQVKLKLKSQEQRVTLKFLWSDIQWVD